MKSSFFIIGVIILLMSCTSTYKKNRQKELIQQQQEELLKQITLKGVTLGVKYYGDTIFNNSVGGINGVLTIQSLSNNCPYKITFKSSDTLTYHDFEEFKLSSKNKYKIKWYQQINDKSKFYWPKDGLGFWLIRKSLPDDNYELTFSIHDIAIIDSL